MASKIDELEAEALSLPSPGGHDSSAGLSQASTKRRTRRSSKMPAEVR